MDEEDDELCSEVVRMAILGSEAINEAIDVAVQGIGNLIVQETTEEDAMEHAIGDANTEQERSNQMVQETNFTQNKKFRGVYGAGSKATVNRKKAVKRKACAVQGINNQIHRYFASSLKKPNPPVLNDYEEDEIDTLSHEECLDQLSSSKAASVSSICLSHSDHTDRTGYPNHGGEGPWLYFSSPVRQLRKSPRFWSRCIGSISFKSQ